MFPYLQAIVRTLETFNYHSVLLAYKIYYILLKKNLHSLYTY